MCLATSTANEAGNQEVQEFSSWLLQVGDGHEGVLIKGQNKDVRQLKIPSQYLLQEGDNNLQQLIKFIYNTELLTYPTPALIAERAIICPKNDTVREINNIVQAFTPRESITYYSTDSMVPHSKNGEETDATYPIEYLNMLSFNGIPDHCLQLKKLPNNVDAKYRLKEWFV
ncbi:uncharacterized protein LOC110875522 [Helianthus annuus]|uniref:uncharacterized protein LOC110875522 n=1 Tax=Helianthus annuus TaxID=4232 RepID=UPI000B8F3DA7|nr:uncharacterized protein LOC110875522 [Helianthus annuus]